MPEVDHVLDNEAKLQARELSRPRRAGAFASTTSRQCGRPRRHLVDGFEGRARAYLQVQQGCDHRCTFCIIPYARGPAARCRSARSSTQARRLVDRRLREIVLTGVDLTAYGADLPGRPSLGQMVRRLLARCRSCRGCASPRSTRSRSTRSCGAARRGGAADAASASVAAGRRRSDPEADEAAAQPRPMRSPLRGVPAALRPGIALGADLIAGFPTETEAMFETQPRAGRGVRPRLPPRVSLFEPAARHAGGADAASPASALAQRARRRGCAPWVRRHSPVILGSRGRPQRIGAGGKPRARGACGAFRSRASSLARHRRARSLPRRSSPATVRHLIARRRDMTDASCRRREAAAGSAGCAKACRAARPSSPRASPPSSPGAGSTRRRSTNSRSC